MTWIAIAGVTWLVAAWVFILASLLQALREAKRFDDIAERPERNGRKR